MKGRNDIISILFRKIKTIFSWEKVKCPDISKKKIRDFSIRGHP